MISQSGFRLEKPNSCYPISVLFKELERDSSLYLSVGPCSFYKKLKKKHRAKVLKTEIKAPRKYHPRARRNIADGRDQVPASVIEADREGHRSPTGSAQHRRQLQPSRQGHAQASRRSLAR